MALWHLLVLLLVFVLELVTCQYDTKEIEVDASKHDEQFFNFLSRPDIDAPRWSSTVYNASALAPGHWFVGPYGIVDQTDNDKAYVGPGIYNSLSGELVWNGGSELDHFNVYGLKVSKFRGEDVLTFLQPQESHGVIMDSLYNIIRHVRIGIWRENDNMHDFQLVEGQEEGSTSALYHVTEHRTASRAESLAIEYDGQCNALFTGFQERDVSTDEIVFSWSPYGKIALNESYWYPVTDTSGQYSTDTMCAPERGLDYLHANSIDKLPDGDYLMSSRHAYTIYKISSKDGSIIWRLGGKMSDFKMEEGTHFSAQHDARCISQNNTHMVISLMDNAVGIYEGHTSNPNSRGLLLSVDTANMIASEIMHFDHPDGIGGYADGRGNVQILPNGNAFVSWKDNCLHSEYTSDGTLIAKAEFPAGLKTYRSFKFPWVGHAIQKPAVYSHVVSDEEVEGGLRTEVHVSWNGDTQAGTWYLYETDVDGNTSELLNTTARNGFETVISCEGYVPYIKVDADNWGGARLTRSESDPIETIFQHDVGTESAPAAAIASAPETAGEEDDGFLQTMFIFAVVAFPGGVTIGVVLFYFGWKLWSRGSLSLPQRRRASHIMLNERAEKADWSPETDRLLHGDDGSLDDSQRPSREEYDLG